MNDIATLSSLLAEPSTSHYCVLTYNSHNIGDYIQTLALLQWVTPQARVFRDAVEPHRELDLIANGWLSKGPLPKIKDYRDIKYVGIHVSPRLRNTQTVRKFQGVSFVGSRDTVTHQYLRAAGISSRVCGCATLTFPENLEPRTNAIYAIDVPEDVSSRLRRAYDGNYEIVVDTHIVPRTPGPTIPRERELELYTDAYERLMRYRNASLVVTSRIHALLPSIAFGTPVIWLPPADDRASVLATSDVPCISRKSWRRWLDSLGSKYLTIPDPVEHAGTRKRYLEFLEECLEPTGRADAVAMAHEGSPKPEGWVQP